MSFATGSKEALKSGTDIVDNRPGASGNIGAEYVSKASPDGYTVMVCPPSPLVTNKALYAKLAYDPDAFVPVTVISIAPVVLMVNQKVPAETLQELISLAKTHPGKLNYASGGGGSHTHLTSELFVSMAGITMGHIPCKGMAPAVVDDVAERLLDLNIEAIGGTPAEMAQFLRQERERWGNVIRMTGIKVE